MVRAEKIANGNVFSVISYPKTHTLRYIDVLITGKYIEHCKDITNNNLYRGSTNQRIIDCKASLVAGSKVLVEGLPNNLK